MKKIYLLTTVLFLLTAYSYAQQWQWAKYYSVSGGSTAKDKITKSAMDEDGNVYFLGRFWPLGEIDGERIFDATEFDTGTSGQIIAKIDVHGNLVWKKIIKFFNGNDNPQGPHWMQLKGDRLYVLGDVEVTGENYYSYIYYLDTMVNYRDFSNLPPEQWRPPFGKYGRMNCFIVFDLDGNVIDQHFLQYKRQNHYYVRPFTAGGSALFYVDRSENIYLFTLLEIDGADPSSYTYTVIDGEVRDTFYISDAGPYMTNYPTYKYVLYKFSPDFNLQWVKPYVMFTEDGAQTRINLNEGNITDYPYGISGDDEDNFYISGYIRTSYMLDSAYKYNYPIRYYFDSVHYGIVHDIASAQDLPFLIKYDTAGNVKWNQQLHTKTTNTRPSAGQYFLGNTITEQHVFVLGTGTEFSHTGGDTIFMDADMQIPLSRPNSNQRIRGFFIRYNRETGQYINHGIIPAEERSFTGIQPAVINNHVITQGNYTPNLANLLIARFRDDGRFMGADTIFFSLYGGDGEVLVNESGYLFTHFTTRGTIATFGDITVQSVWMTVSDAFYGMMYDTTLLTPYPTRIEDTPPHSQSSRVYLHPNPTTGSMRLLGELDGFVKIEIYDITGRKLIEKEYLDFDLTTYNSGIYLVKAYFSNGEAITLKAIKN